MWAVPDLPCQFPGLSIFETPGKPESVISLLKNYSFSGIRISNLTKQAQN